MFVGMRDVILKQMELADNYAFLRRMGVKAMEVRVQPDMTLNAFEPVQGETLRIGSEVECRKVLDAAGQAGVRIGGILLNTTYHLLKFDAEKEKRWIAASAEFAKQAGLAALRIDVCHDMKNGESEDEFLGRIEPRLEEHLKVAAESGVRLAVENHGAFTNRREFMARLLDRFSSWDLCVTLDTGNFYCTGGYPLSEVYDVAREFSSKVIHVHVKNISYPPEAREVQGHNGCPYSEHTCPIDQGDVDHVKMLSILQDAGYTGGIYIEDESLGKFSPPERIENVSRTISYLRGILACRGVARSGWG